VKIIYTNSITGVSSSATQLSSDYAIAKVENNYPKQPYISDAATATITVTCPGAEAIFFSYLAESVTVTFKDSGASTLSTETYSNTYTLSEQYLLNEKTHWNDSVFVACPATTNTDCFNQFDRRQRQFRRMGDSKQWESRQITSECCKHLF